MGIRIALGAAWLAGLLLVPDAALAQGRQISGTVTRTVGGRPIVGATVTAAGVTEIGRTNEQGRYTISVPAGDVRLTIRAIGFTRKEAVVPAGQTTLDVTLSEDVFKLEEVVVTGQATTAERRNATTAISYVSGEDLAKVATPTIENALAGRIAGVNLQSNSGAPGGGIQMQIRGNTTILGAFDPLYVIDGVIYSNATIAGGRGSPVAAAFATAEDDAVNRVADINPADIASIEVLKGAAASSIYGSKASNGVVVITTLRGQQGAPRVNFSSRFGVFSLANELETRRFSSVADAKARFDDPAAGPVIDSIAAANGGQLPYFDHYNQIYGQKELSYEFVTDVSGGTEATRYFVSGTWKRDEGIERNTGFGRQGLRVNFDQRLGQKFDVKVSTVFNRAFHARGWNNNCNNYGCAGYFLAYTPSFLDLRPNPDGTFKDPLPGGLQQLANPIQTSLLAENKTETYRFTGGLTLNFNAHSGERSTLRFVTSGGSDIFEQQDNIWTPNELFFERTQTLPGTAIENNGIGRNMNWNLNAVHNYRFGTWSATTSAGLQFEDRQLSTSRITTTNLVPGQRNVNQGTNFVIQDNFTKERTLAVYLNEELLLLDDRLILSAGMRAERSSVNGDTEKYYVFPRASGAYRFANLLGEGSELKVRGSYGETGNQPLFGQKFTNLNTPVIGGQSGFTVAGAAGSPNIEPERLKEVDAGVDLTLLDGRATFEATFYTRNTTNLLLQRVPAPSSGFTQQTINGGKIRNRGFEIAAGYTPIQQRDVSLVLRSTFTSNRSKVIEMPVPSFRPPLSGFGGLGVTFIQVGAPVTQIHGFAFDASGNRTPTTVRIGDTNPDFQLGLTSDLSWKALNLSTVWQWQQGGDIINLTEFLYVDSRLSADFGSPAYLERVEAYNEGVMTPFIEDASFLKLREVSLGWLVPERLVAGLGWGVRDVRLSLTGRNLLTFTGYTGLDPEVANLGSAAIRNNLDVSPYPPSRSIFFNIAVGF